MSHLRKVVAVGAAVIAVAGGGTALAAGTSSASAGVYQGCLSAANGSLYSVALNPAGDPQCRPHDTAVTWNQTGPAGPQGPKGDTGGTGPLGPKGDTGATGQAGADGSQGPVGLTGATGATGPTGAMGPQGPKGDAGPAGSQGAKGDMGAAGPQGPAGAGMSLVVNKVSGLVPPGKTVTIDAPCPSGSVVTGGGGDVEPADNATNAALTGSFPLDVDGDGKADDWRVLAYNTDWFNSYFIRVWVICARGVSATS